MQCWKSVLLASGLWIVLVGGCGAPGGDATTTAAPQWLTDVTEESGLRFVYETGGDGGFLMPEIMASGLALFDYDDDGDLDLYFANGRSNRLFRQENGGRFADVTDASGLGDTGYGMGVAVGDIDNDGDRDVYVTNYGPDRLYRNRGDGSFEDVTASAGISVDGWSCSASFLDYDGDGFLDLHVARYVRYDPRKRCTDAAGRPDYCSPAVFPPEYDVLLHNDGDGTFTDVSEPAGILSSIGAGLGVMTADFDDDGLVDIFVGNDGDANHLWINQGDGTFHEQALLAGVAFNLDGEAEASMGLLAADFDGDLDFDLFLTHLAEESNTLYRNRGGTRGFEDFTSGSGLNLDSLPFTGFGTAAIDLEHDGDLDIVLVNGRVTTGTVREGSLVGPPWNLFSEPNLVYFNDGSGRFELARETALGFTAPIEVSRGLVAGDIDADGDLDVVFVNLESPARLYRNDAPGRGNWLSVRAIDPRLRRDAIGARIILTAGGSRQVRHITRGLSYLSSTVPRAHFGLGGVERVEGIEVRWPDGLVESFAVGEANREVTVTRGDGDGG